MTAKTPESLSPVLVRAVVGVSGGIIGEGFDRKTRLLDDLGIDSLALAELIEILSLEAKIEISDEETACIWTVGDLQDVLDRHSRNLKLSLGN